MRRATAPDPCRMTSVLLAGVLAAFLITTFVAALQRAPTRLRCPECAGDTQPVEAPRWLRQGATRMVMRWCPACSWEGIGRVGAEWVPGRRTAHESGFHWGDERLPEDFGFRFAPAPEVLADAEPPHHPSGFRFARSDAPSPAHPSGFNWGERVGRPAFPLGGGAPEGTAGWTSPAGFRWRPPAPSTAGFRWRDEEDGPRTHPVFHWKDAG